VYEGDYHGNPAVYPIGCAGVITHAEKLPDGRSNVVLRGIEKFRIVEEDRSRAYRVASVEALPETTSETDRTQLRQQRQRLETLLIAAIERGGADPRFPPAIADDDLVNALAQYLSLSPVERQALLERDGILARCHGLIDLLEMKNFQPPTGWGNGSGIH
jgi:Lon protease-like protein